MRRNGKLLRHGTHEKVVRTGEWRYNAPRPGRDTLAANAKEQFARLIDRAFDAMLAKYTGGGA
jgi:hypothetical protein